MKVSFVYGNLDFVTNFFTGEKVMNSIRWFGQDHWKNLELENCEYGFCKEYENMRYVRMDGGGHSTWNNEKNIKRNLEILNKLAYD